MGYEPLVKQNPLRVLKLTGNDKKMGLIMARAGIGKTALLVQIALDAILRGKRVLHISVGESLDKTKLWYDDMLQAVLNDCPVAKPHELIDMVRQHRMIMTFKVGGFDRERLAERLHDLIEQHIFTPDCVVIDGFDFAAADHAKLEGIRALMEELKLQTWFSATSHRDDARVSPSGVPAPCHEMDDLFETVALLKSYQDHVQLEILRDNGKKAEENSHLRLDPATMMVKQA